MIEQRHLFVIGNKNWNTLSRMMGAEQIGWQVSWSVPFWGHGLPAWRRFPQYRFRDGPDIYRYNQNLLHDAIVAKPDVIWVEEPMFTYASTLEVIRKRIGATLVCAYSDDPRDPAKKSRHYSQALKIYDVIFTTKDDLLQYYFDQGCHCPSKFWKGFDPKRIYPLNLTSGELQHFQSNVVFVGHVDFVRGKPMRLSHMMALARAIPSTKIWGQSWGKVSWPDELKHVLHPYQIDGLDYTRAICGSKVAVQIPSRLARDTHSSRSIEIPACGRFMLAERTVDHQALFEEDKEAVFFNSTAEMVDKAKYYLKHENPREKIARAGYERCLRSGYSNYERIKQMLTVVENVRQDKWMG